MGLLEIEDPLYYIANLANSAKRMELCVPGRIRRRVVDGFPARTLSKHLPDDGVGYMEEPRQVHGCNRDVVLECVIGERLADEIPALLIRLSMRPKRLAACSSII